MYSALDIVNSVLSSLSDQAVNALGETQLSDQVADIVRTNYYQLVLEAPQEYRKAAVILSAPFDLPTKLRPQEAMFGDIYHIDYYYKDRVVHVQQVTPEEFLRIVGRRDAAQSELIVDGSIRYRIYSGRAPRYCTSFNGQDIVFDAYDRDYSTTISPAHLTVLAEFVRRIDVASGDKLQLPAILCQQLLNVSTAQALEMFDKTGSPAMRANEARLRRKIFRGQGTNSVPMTPRSYGRK